MLLAVLIATCTGLIMRARCLWLFCLFAPKTCTTARPKCTLLHSRHIHDYTPDMCTIALSTCAPLHSQLALPRYSYVRDPPSSLLPFISVFVFYCQPGGIVLTSRRKALASAFSPQPRHAALRLGTPAHRTYRMIALPRLRQHHVGRPSPGKHIIPGVFCKHIGCGHIALFTILYVSEADVLLLLDDAS